jgi:hypothetical protein
MKHLTFYLAFFAFFIKSTQTVSGQHIDGQIRYFSEIQTLYPRIEGRVPVFRKISLCGGLSEDGLQMITLSGQYALFDWLKVKTGCGYHAQNNFHLVVGLNTKLEKKNYEIEGYINGYVDHKSLYASEFEFFRKFRKFDLGITTDIEYGKFFPLWREVQPEILKEQLFLGGPIIRLRLNSNVAIKFFGMFGQEKIGHHPKVFACKAGIGFVFHTQDTQHQS